jgi:hypothetical protein
MADSDSWITAGETDDIEDIVDSEPMKYVATTPPPPPRHVILMSDGSMGRIGGRGMQLSRTQRAMIRIMNDHGVPLSTIQESLNCQRATVIATINQTRKKKDDVSKDYEAVINFVDFVKRYPAETRGRPVSALFRNGHGPWILIRVHS